MSLASLACEGDQRSGWAFPFGGTLVWLWGGMENMEETRASKFFCWAWFMGRGPISRFHSAALFVSPAGYVIVR